MFETSPIVALFFLHLIVSLVKRGLGLTWDGSGCVGFGWVEWVCLSWFEFGWDDFVWVDMGGQFGWVWLGLVSFG